MLLERSRKMPRRIYEFRCSDNHITEQYIDEKEGQTTCSICDKTAFRIVSAVKCSLDPISGHFPDATAKWAKNRDYQIKRERREENS